MSGVGSVEFPKTGGEYSKKATRKAISTRAANRNKKKVLGEIEIEEACKVFEGIVNAIAIQLSCLDILTMPTVIGLGWQVVGNMG